MAVGFSILTVCAGNIHRSPLAAALLDTWARWYLPPSLTDDVRVRSAGLGAPEGAPMGRRVQLFAKALGADGSGHRATQISDDLIAESELVLVASRRQRDDVLSRVPSALRRTFTIREAGRVAASLDDDGARPASVQDLTSLVAALADHRGSHADAEGDDIIDPQGKDDDAYLQMVREEVIPLVALARVLFGMPKGDVDAYLAAAEDPAALLARGAASEPQ